jgi:hypothetical protein
MSDIHKRAIEGLERKIEIFTHDIDSTKLSMVGLAKADPKWLEMSVEVVEKQNKLCGCKEALKKEQEMLFAPFPPGIISTLTDFGYSLPLSRFDIRNKNDGKEYHVFDRFVVLDKYYTPILDAFQQSVESGDGGMYFIETEGKILDTGQVTSYKWVSENIRKFSDPSSRVNMKTVPQFIRSCVVERMPKQIRQKTRNKLTGSFGKPSYPVPINTAFNKRFGWAEFAEENNLDPYQPLMKITNLWNLHHPELMKSGKYEERDKKAANLIEEAVRKEAAVTLEQKGGSYSMPFYRSMVRADEPLSYKVRLTDSKTFCVESLNAKTKTDFYRPKMEKITYNDAMNMINDAWEKELARKNMIRDRFLGGLK